MIIDFLKHDPVKKSIKADICIVGTGPAGISLALQLINSGKSVCLLEAGGREPVAINNEHPYQGEVTGRPYEIAFTRLRYFGGTSNHWGGWCRPLDPIDFKKKDYIPLSGWPISYDDLVPYYKKALDVCEIDTGGLGLDGFNTNFADSSVLPQHSDILTNKNFFFSPPTRFGKRYSKNLEEADNISCYLNATATEFITGADNISLLKGISSSGKPFSVEADSFVLAMGAIENARMLLANNVAYQSDFVGRCFSDHTGKTVAQAVISSENKYFRHNEHTTGDFSVLPHLSFKEPYILGNELINFGAILNPVMQTTGVSASVMNLLKFENKKPMDAFHVLIRMENTPNPDSTISLINQKDSYGMPRIKLNWMPNAFDFKAAERIGQLFADEMITKNFGRVKIKPFDIADARRNATIQAHHLGTTRMSADPEQGVVNKDLRTHDIDNLYVLGSSCFPSFGFSNPTLTIVALAVRLGEKLSKA